MCFAGYVTPNPLSRFCRFRGFLWVNPFSATHAHVLRRNDVHVEEYFTFFLPGNGVSLIGGFIVLFVVLFVAFFGVPNQFNWI